MVSNGMINGSRVVLNSERDVEYTGSNDDERGRRWSARTQRRRIALWLESTACENAHTGANRTKQPIRAPHVMVVRATVNSLLSELN